MKRSSNVKVTLTDLKDSYEKAALKLLDLAFPYMLKNNDGSAARHMYIDGRELEDQKFRIPLDERVSNESHLHHGVQDSTRAWNRVG
jgi:hypothetical protein